MKTYTLEEATKTGFAAVLKEACGDETVALVDGDVRVVLTPLNPDKMTYSPDWYTDEDIALQNLFAAESARNSEAAVRAIIAE